VSRHWPQFGQHGKESVTVRQVLQHRSGLPVARSASRDALVMTDWDRSVRRIERASLTWPPGQVPAYHYISYGFILGELVRRVSGAGVADFPAVGISATARDLARFYQALLCGGELDGVRVLRAATIEQARRPSSHGELDRFLKLPIRWSQGFQLGGPSPEPAAHRPMGRLTSPQAFGHNGSNCCIAWAGPAHDLVFVYLTDRLIGGHEGARHQGRVGDAVIAACS
jgi:CubicO group peptidase (beta-lactamase class C family)